MTTNTAITAIILVGGQGQRFDLRDKGLVEWQGKPLVQHVLDRIKDQSDQIIINCNRNSEQYRSFGYTLSSDQLTGFQGPLAGIQASLSLAKNDWVLICPCDTPLLPKTLATALLQQATKQQADLAYPMTSERKHFLPVLLKASLLEDINHYLKAGGRSMYGFYKAVNTIEVEFDDTNDAFSNVNCPDDLINL